MQKQPAIDLKKQLSAIFFFFLCTAIGMAQDERTNVLAVVTRFFDTMEKNDPLGFNALFLENAYAYSVRQQNDSTIVRSRVFNPSSSKDTLKERLQEEGVIVHIHEKLAAVWAPYDFWINDIHSHCGFEVFTLIKKDATWKIASLTYTVEKEACQK